jgi:hypothetical protein
MSERDKLFRLLRFVVIGFLCLIALMFIWVLFQTTGSPSHK